MRLVGGAVEVKNRLLGNRRSKLPKNIYPICWSPTSLQSNQNPQGVSHSAAKTQSSVSALNCEALIWGWQRDFRQSVGNAIQMFKIVSSMGIVKTKRKVSWMVTPQNSSNGDLRRLFIVHSIWRYFLTESFIVLSFNWKYLTYDKLSWLTMSWTPPKCSFQIYNPLHGSTEQVSELWVGWRTGDNLQRPFLMASSAFISTTPCLQHQGSH